MSKLTPRQIATLADMLSYCRPHGEPHDRIFRRRFLLDLPNAELDAHKNIHVMIGESSILWSSHTDTVHHEDGRQSLHVDHVERTIQLSRRSRRSSSCLGGDDTVGVFLMREMILRGVPGRYVFHYGEESGCIGSGDLASCNPELLDGVRFAIALDRAGTADVVTSQNGRTCASDAFAYSIAKQLDGVSDYKPARGIFTDTAEYMDLIPECTNLSVGYYHAHTSDEYVDFDHVGRLLIALVGLDESSLVCERDPIEQQRKEREERRSRVVYTCARPRLFSPSTVISRRWWEDDPITNGDDATSHPDPYLDPYAYNGDDWPSSTLRRTRDVTRDWEWCDSCNAPVVPDGYELDDHGYPYDFDGEVCACSSDDRAFLAYLRSQ